MRKAMLFAVIAAFGAAVHAADPAADFPNKPIRVMGQGVGSTADYLSRYVGQKLTEHWGQTVVVDNRSGAGGTIPTDVVAKATPDGYTLLMGHAGTHVSAVSLYRNLPYDPVKDFAPISLVAKLVTVLVAHPSIPASNAQELIAYAKQKGNLNYASAGNGTISHLTGELFNQVAGLKLQHVPYKSAGAALTGLIGGETPVSFLSPITAHTQLKAGKLKAFAVSSKTRFVGVPDIPSAPEAGIPGMEAVLWFGLFAPAKTPRPIVTKLNKTVVGILHRPDVKEAILTRGGEVAPSTPEELAAWVKSELDKWTPIINAAGIRAG
ncbi:MAG: tripartite tricarboxylate transporter substrate binding protein [Betaproteobacteria bacterium]|nr:tripartite tricarboxylate transporter substrate binding protein [Betaproteobacteria bacterium]